MRLMGVFFVALCGGLIGAAFFSFVLSDGSAFAQKEDQPKVITASEIKLVDSNGKMVGHIKGKGINGILRAQT